MSPRSSITSIEKTGHKDSEQTSVDSGKNDKTNCDTEQPPTCEKIIHTGSEKSQVDEKHSKAEGSNLNSSPDIVNSTSKKVYKTEMIWFSSQQFQWKVIVFLLFTQDALR